MAVVRASKGGGFTGPFAQVCAWFVQDSSRSAPQQVKFTEYGVAQSITSKVQVPRDGPGEAEFSSWFRPLAGGWLSGERLSV